MIDQTQPKAKPGVLYTELYIVPDLKGLEWGPRTTAVIQNALASYHGVQWSGVLRRNYVDEMVIYCGKDLEDTTEVKFPADPCGAGWIHVSDSDMDRGGTVYQRVVWALQQELARCEQIAADAEAEKEDVPY